MERATLKQRFLASLIDYSILLAVVIISIVTILGKYRYPEHLLINLLVVIVLNGLLFSKDISTQSPGKYLLKLKIVKKADFGHPSWPMLVLRNILWCLGIIEIIFLLVDKEHERLGDKVTGTIVIKQPDQIDTERYTHNTALEGFKEKEFPYGSTENEGKYSTYLKTYFYVAIISTSILIFQTGTITFSLKDITQGLFTVVGFVAFFGYIYNKRIFNHFIWIVLICLFFSWEIGNYLFIKNTWYANLLILVVLSPKYWGVALYPFTTLAVSEEARLSNISKRDAIVARFKLVFVILSALAIISQFVILAVSFIQIIS
jgi:uncharacterized RDD family membrane protein YckC